MVITALNLQDQHSQLLRSVVLPQEQPASLSTPITVWWGQQDLVKNATELC